MPKYRNIFRQIMNDNEELFQEFSQIHAKYEQDSKKWQDEYNQKGEEVMKLLRDGERILCGKTERGKYAVYSSKLADKYWNEIRAFFPLIDFVGAKIK